MTLVLVPNGWPCALAECPPGPFLFGGELSFKAARASEMEVYNSTGKGLVERIGSDAEVAKLVVQPVVMRSVEEETC